MAKKKYTVSIDKLALNRYFFTVEADSEEELESEIGILIERGGVPDKVVHDVPSSEGYVEYLEREDYKKLEEGEQFVPDKEAQSPTFILDISPGVSLHKCLNTGICYVGDLNEGKRYVPFAMAKDPKTTDWYPEDTILYSKTLMAYINVSIIDPGVPHFQAMVDETTCLQAQKVIQAHLERDKKDEPK